MSVSIEVLHSRQASF